MLEANQPEGSRINAHLPGRAENADARLSYKFQRLREKVRAAIDSGELNGKLPGERQLARRFRVNAKTLSKALTDLAAEGVLERSIGRGTFVKRTAATPNTTQIDAAPANVDRWLILCDPQETQSAMVQALCGVNPSAQVVEGSASLRPSFLNAFKAVIDLSHSTSQGFLRDLVVRNMAVVLVGREPANYSVNAVLVDRVLGASCIAREMMLAGHRRFVAVERRGSTQISEAIRKAAQRYAPDASVDIAFASEAADAIDQGDTAVICDSVASAEQVRAALHKLNIEIPARVSLAAVDACVGEPPCSGYFVTVEQKLEAITQLLRESSNRRPNTIWLAGALTDIGTIGPVQTLRDTGLQEEFARSPAGASL